MVTPHIAEVLLEANTHNRHLSEATVDKYAYEMRHDEWLLSASGIGFDRNGVLCDGQHRLSAIVKSGATVPMLIAYGLAPASQEKVDRQKKRSLFDVFSIAGYASKKKEVQIATTLVLWKFRKDLYIKSSCISDSEVKMCLECHKESINEILKQPGCNEKGFGRIGYLSVVVLYYEMFPEKAMSFFRSVYTGAMLSIDHPAMRLRRYLIGDGGYIKTSVALGGCSLQLSDIKKTLFAINAYHEGRKITALKEATDFSMVVG
jgi:hypothetical protein